MNQKVYRYVEFNMGTAKMASLMYAIIMCKCKITSTHTLGYEYTRSQNSRNGAEVMIEIDINAIPMFELYSGMTLETQGPLTLN